MMSKVYDRLPPNEDREPLGLVSLDKLRVLVVDDNEDNLLLISFILEESAMQVMTATSASEAFNLFLQTKPDILVCDIAMPSEDGYWLIRKIRNLEPCQGGLIPAIALTASAREEDRILCMNAGFQVHIAKPIEPTKLVEIVVELARQIC